ncbi:MAG: ABC transporter permease [Gammaproteobacteria bacterium]|jgi:putative ABC transport system permease protein|nr:ABC transporter permease [Gammaproteobacteria bacterium]MBT3723770.1 ABC transporter permease [Gammaproteobacteria bacterium]MBT4075775.1 ABC transporter permease [Gammaproteobacteria bacterium]MBT4196436.1 ABC transporter permease [Gammaproteobacteria bacterium]MBT4448143.1 ABC transporter permease [Gammaproteobacteria bacterium]
MLTPDIMLYGWKSLKGYRTRTILMLMAMSISVASVLLLTALGEGARRYVTGEFASLGTNMVIVMPGKSETAGMGLSTMMGVTPRDLTLDDARALTRHSAVTRIAPLNIGAVEVSWKNRKREVTILGSTSEILKLRHWELASGQFLPKADWDRATPVCVIGKKIRDEIFGAHAALGQWIRLGENRYRVIGILASEGRSLDVDVEEIVIIPVASAQSLLNTPSLFRILIETKSRESMLSVVDFSIQTIKQRHHDEEDVTVITQDAVIQTFDNILTALTYAVGGIAAISLAVSGILIMNVMLVAVSQRTAEIGLLKALGASSKNILRLILTEAILLSLLGTFVGFIFGLTGCWAIRLALPALQAYPPLWAMLASFIVAISTGLLFSLLPARKASRLDPVFALQGH